MANVKTFEVQIKEHPELGDLGVVSPQLQGHFDPAMGLGLAHDILEHIAPHPHPYVDEFLALGAFIHLRVEQGFFRSYNFVSLGYEIEDLLRNYWYGDADPIPDCEEPIEDHCYLNSIIHAVTEGLRIFVEEEELEDESLALIPSVKQISKWICLGYKKAAQFYESQDVDPYAVCHTVFKEIGTKVDQWLKNAEEGDLGILTVDFDEYEVYLEF